MAMPEPKQPATPVGEVLLVTDGEGAVRALDFADHEARMTRLLVRMYGNFGKGREARGCPRHEKRVALIFPP